jgi:hypothetical protein
LHLRHARHLVSRFFGVLGNRSLSPIEQLSVAASLTEAEASVFWDQHPIDQRHAYVVAARVEGALGENREAVAAALLHDTGKRHSSAGPVGRSLATIADGLRLPLPADWRRYRNHGPLGASDLEALGASRLSIAFARGHNDPPGEIDSDVWQALQAADDA